MRFHEPTVKGIARYLHDATVHEKSLRLHISEIAPGTSAHPPHRHGGFEAFYVLEGAGTVEIDGEQTPLGAGETVVFDPRKLHGLTNTGTQPMRYMVIRCGQEAE